MSSYFQSLRDGERDRESDRDRSRRDGDRETDRRSDRDPSSSARPTGAVDYERSAQRASGRSEPGSSRQEEHPEPRSSRDQDASRSRLRSTVQVANDDGRSNMGGQAYGGGSASSLPPPPSNSGGDGRFYGQTMSMGNVYQASEAQGSREGRYPQAGTSRSAGGNGVSMGAARDNYQEPLLMNSKQHSYSIDNYAGSRSSGAPQQDRSMPDRYSPRDAGPAQTYLMPSPYTNGALPAAMADRLGRREYPREQQPSTYESRQLETANRDRPSDRQRERSPARGHGGNGGYPGGGPMPSSVMSNNPSRERDRISQAEADRWSSRNGGGGGFGGSRPGEGPPRAMGGMERRDDFGGDRGRGGGGGYGDARAEARHMDARQQQGLAPLAPAGGGFGGGDRPRHTPIQGPPPRERGEMQASRGPRDPSRASAAALAVAAQWDSTPGGAFPPPPPPPGARRELGLDDRRRSGVAPLVIPFSGGGVGGGPRASGAPLLPGQGGSSYQSRMAEREMMEQRDRQPRVRDDREREGERQGREPRIRSPPGRADLRLAPGNRLNPSHDANHPLITEDVESATRGIDAYLSAPVVAHIRGLLRKLCESRGVLGCGVQRSSPRQPACRVPQRHSHRARGGAVASCDMPLVQSAASGSGALQPVINMCAAIVLNIGDMSCTVWAPLKEIKTEDLQIAATERLSGVSWYTIKRPNAMIASVMRTAAENATRPPELRPPAQQRRHTPRPPATPPTPPGQPAASPSGSSPASAAAAARTSAPELEEGEAVIGTACYALDAEAAAAADAAGEESEAGLIATGDAEMDEEEEDLDMEDPLRELEAAEEGLEGELDAGGEEEGINIGAGDRYHSAAAAAAAAAAPGGEGDDDSPRSQPRSRSPSTSRTRSRSRSRSKSPTGWGSSPSRSKSTAAADPAARDAAADAGDAEASAGDAAADGGDVHDDATLVSASLVDATPSSPVQQEAEHAATAEDAVMADTEAPSAETAPAAAAAVPQEPAAAPLPPKVAKKAALKRAAAAPAAAAAAATVPAPATAAEPLPTPTAAKGRKAAAGAAKAPSASAPDASTPDTLPAGAVQADVCAAADGATATAEPSLGQAASSPSSTQAEHNSPGALAGSEEPGAAKSVGLVGVSSGGRGRGKRGKPGDGGGDDAGGAAPGSERASAAPSQRGRKKK
ncbi:MAG: hypothetical protein WDW38_002554 [Sanguina aurantia]